MTESTNRSNPRPVAQCVHCGAECAEHAVESAGRIFCCTGCQLVHDIVGTEGVCDVLGNESIAEERFTRIGIPRFAYLDDPSVRERHITFQDGSTARCTLRMPTIHCASCIWTLENLHRIDPAIYRSEVDFMKRIVHLHFEKDKISFRQVVELCTRLGYEPDLHTEGEAEADHRVHAMRTLMMKLGVAGFAFGNAMIFSAPDYLASMHGDARALTPAFVTLFAVLRCILSLPVLLFSASDYFTNSWNALRNRSISLDVPIAMGLLALFVRSMVDIATGSGTGYLDSFTGLVFFLLTARVVQTKSFAALSFDRTYASFFPLSVMRKESDGQYRSVSLHHVKEGDAIHVRHNEIVPADTLLQSTHAHVDYSFVTGESDVCEVVRGAIVFAGGRIVGADTYGTVVRGVSRSYLTSLWNNSVFHQEKLRRAQRISRVFAVAFTVTVLSIAIVTAVAWWPDVTMALSASVAVLIVACPCALTLASPFIYGAAMTRLGRSGLYLRSADVVADMQDIDTVVFDKTGTLTRSSSHLVEYSGAPLSDDDLALVHRASMASHHPLSRELCSWMTTQRGTAGHDTDEDAEAMIFEEVAGKGTRCMIGAHEVMLGSREFVGAASCLSPDAVVDDASVHVRIDGVVRGVFNIRLLMREGAERMLATLSARYEVWMLSGDNERHGRTLMKVIPEQRMRFGQTPEDKMRFIEGLQKQGRRVMMIGDGVNDAGALRRADCGIAVSEQSGSFTPASDAIIAADALRYLPAMMSHARYAHGVLVLAFAVSVIYNAVGISMACGGHLTPVFAAFFMPLSSWSVVGIAFGLMQRRTSDTKAMRMASEHGEQPTDKPVMSESAVNISINGNGNHGNAVPAHRL